MFYLMLLISVVFVCVVLYYVRRLIRHFEDSINQRLRETEACYLDLQRQKANILSEKGVLEKKALEIFTLYELTSKITQQSNEKDAFKVFESALRENVTFNDCRFIDIASKDEQPTQSNEGDFVFALKGKRRQFGHLVVSDLSPEDKDKVMILGNQFALALRRVKLYREIEELAITDSLTNVHTRRYFLERFKEELQRSKSRKAELAFLMIDVDHFKKFNDRYGHLVGDQILRAIGSIIKDNIREIDIVGRYGGEEFCVVLPDTDRDGANFAAERIRTAVEEETIKAYDTTIRVTVSIGMSSFPGDGKISAELIDKSDWALYRAKKKGRNCVCTFGRYE